MNTVIEMAREAQIVPYIVGPANIEYIGRLERFAALVRAEALAEQPAQQEPVASLLVGQDSDGRYVSIAAKAHADTLPLGEHKLYTSPPAQRKPLTPLLFSRRKSIAEKLGVPMDAAFNAIVREVETAHDIAIEAAHGIKGGE